ncbi:hypothetical protein VPH1254_0029 [Vibrio phage 1254]|nr:hypothetical protein SIPHO018v1_100027 [Vibrio phage 11E33.1]QZI86721.1 hypothetical protein SIPHO019v1_60002 [Vibrio phage 82E32.1]QZI92569.1 hypothetical protein SIPHO017v1_p0036 [Vibrio phage 19E33.1]QZI92820.1 hypothetical protein SIPHO016v1_p0041 [Vibrio phage 38E33.6a]QZI92946.1 hypothetical protein SIPHO015v1_p0008 [Vibrio phage 82E32.2]QZI93035.1 hypothetical protein SIPHO014v1_p0036 [Vibrio phage 82E32.3]QZI93082.1 hypothetical protein SIPHO013v1_p0021 [Vibrio phage 82E33.2]
MPQTIPSEILNDAHETSMSEETLPTLNGARHYFADVVHKGRIVLCILGEDGQWRPASYDEMMAMMQ